MTSDVTIRRARLIPACSDPVDSELVDVDVSHGRITAVRPHTGVRTGGIDADGAVLVPGLWDAHVHFSTHALLAECLQLPADADLAEIFDRVRQELVTRRDDGLLVGFGYRSATWPVQPSADALDALSLEPIALIAGDLHSLWCNTAGLTAVGASQHPTGLLREEEAFDAMVHLMRTETTHVDALVRGAERRAAAMGVVGVVDMEMQWGIGSWLRRLEGGRSLVRVDVATYPEDLDRLIGLGMRTGTQLGDRLRVGPLKVISDGSLSSLTAHCLAPYPHPIAGSPNGVANHSPEEMLELLSRAGRSGIQGAIHAIGDLACRDALDAFERSGAVGTIEHAQLIHPDDLPRFANLGVGASVQPAHLLEDEAVLDEVWPTSTDRAFPLRALVDAGARLTLGSDAPVSPLDPWLAMDVAVNRPHRPGQGLTPAEALAACTRTRVAVGQPADLALLTQGPAQLEQGNFTTQNSLITLIAGELTHGNVDMVDG
ncbi:amidohydrolase [Tessaracoccus antarcticus]|uniref:Amidohydrolase n=1 Tax=Tessaracoccus antarcticus TaxID=2479848 RepID=A0A3M0G521_9ACTN|nr:amidohydrolase family protein [Tessaracoccus antarcticus]RMB60120.1 amidohydrolase [Tessaracoccus antarcticus]